MWTNFRLPTILLLLSIASGPAWAEDCPNGIVREPGSSSIPSTEPISTNELTIVSDAVLEVGILKGQSYPAGELGRYPHTLYVAEIVNVLKGPTSLRAGSRLRIDRPGGQVVIHCHLFTYDVGSPAFVAGERWILFVVERNAGVYELRSEHIGVWKVDGSHVRDLGWKPAIERQKLVSEISKAAKSSGPLTWGETYHIAVFLTAPRAVEILRARGVNFSLNEDQREQLARRYASPELIDVINRSRR